MEVSVAGDNVRTSVWAPMPRGVDDQSTARMDAYRTSESSYDALRAYTPFPPWLCRQLALDVPAYVQPADTLNVSAADATAQMRQTPPRAAILMAHGIAATRLDYAPLAEALARRGFLVAAPDFADSTLRSAGLSLELAVEGLFITTRGRLFRDAALAERAATMEAVATRLAADLGPPLGSPQLGAAGGVPIGLFGFSLGGSTIANMWDGAPKVFVASPVAEQRDPFAKGGAAGGFSSGPTLQILGVGGDQYAAGDTFVPPHIALNALPAPDRAVITVDFLRDPLPATLPSKHTSLLFANAGHLMLAGSACDFKLATQPNFSPDTRFAARTGAHVPCLGATVQLATQFFDEHFA
jgi:hypothetical protein